MEEIKAGYENVRLQDGDGNKITSAGGAINVNGTFAEEAVVADGGSLPAKVKVVGGHDGSNVQVIRTDTSGGVELGSDTVSILNTTLQSIDNYASSSNSLLTQIDNQLGFAAQESTLTALNAKIPSLAASGGIPVEVLQQDGLIDSGNTTSATLGAGGVFTGTWKDGTNWSAFQLGVFSDRASATNGLNVQFSYDGVTVHHNHYYTYAGGSSGIGYAFPVEFRYFRVVYTNNAVAQATFRLITVLKANSIQPSQYRLTNALSDETQASVTRSLIFGKTTGGGGGYVDVKVNPSGALTVDSTVTSSALPTGAATEATLSALNAKVTACNTGSVTIASSALPSGAATETTLQSVQTAAQSSSFTLSSIDNTVTGLNLKTPGLGQATMANSSPVVIASNQSAISVSASGKTAVNLARIDYSATSVTTGAYVQLLASTSAAVSEVEIFDSSGQTLVLATGGTGSESDKVYIFPGGNGRIPLSIAASTRVAIKAVSATASVGEISVNFYS